MPIPTRSVASSEPDTYSQMSQATTTETIGPGLSSALRKRSVKRGITFNIMLVGHDGLGKRALLSALFGKNLEMPREKKADANSVHLNPQVGIESKTFEIDEPQVRLKLTVVESRNYGEALSLENTHLPLVNYIDQQFEDYFQRESGVRRNIQDKMIHCLFFFVPAIGHGLSKLDLEFLKAIHNRVNVVLIIAKAEALTMSERLAFKRRLKDDLERNQIDVYQMPDPDPDDSDDTKRDIKEIQMQMPFALCTISLGPENYIVPLILGYGEVDHYNREHSDFLLMKTMIHMQIPDLCDTTHETFYENYRFRKIPTKQAVIGK